MCKYLYSIHHFYFDYLAPTALVPPCFEDMDINDLYVLQQKTRLTSVAPPSLIETSKEKKTTVSNFVTNYIIRLKQ